MPPVAIDSIRAAQRLDSRGKPTVQVEVTTSDGIFTAIVPSGASKGDYEAIELRDADSEAFGGNGVLEAVQNVEEVIGPALISHRVDLTAGLKEIDDFMIQLDGTPDKSGLGANAILGVSMACARACAAARKVPLYEFIAREMGSDTRGYTMPVPFFNVLNGGVHSGNAMSFQEFMIAPTGAKSVTQGIQYAAEVYQELMSLLIEKFGKSSIGIGDEGGFAPPISQPSEALDLLMEAFQRSGHQGHFHIGIDPASSEFFKDDAYDLGFKASTSNVKTKGEMADLYHELIQRYPIALLEDPFAQDDWDAWVAFNQTCQVELVGDDLLATNLVRINKANEKKACNALLLKINQIGTVTEALAAANKAFELGWSVFVSHRSGESTDPFIADLAVGVGCGHLKSGAPCRGERVVKYNRLMDIEDSLIAQGQQCRYPGEHFRAAAMAPVHRG
ncbi:phosphopyruvate hydratase [Exophiala mesophila]|uniref:Enolase n=1 Tax=Exophiala mesophila TaxID=212818 RepID=A0A0D1ZP97_EXOME|nr:phosphopyruvate hydratase [Exophiala mesophila]KIV88578.1 phosphopyruvate hydratase [Exophiala mesophila]